MWRPWEADDWDRPDDGETESQMAEAAFMEDHEALRQRNVNARLWELAVAGFFTRDGEYIGPRKG